VNILTRSERRDFPYYVGLLGVLVPSQLSFTDASRRRRIGATDDVPEFSIQTISKAALSAPFVRQPCLPL
jgi:hypothetical protein